MSVGAAIALGAVIGLTLGIVVSVTTEVPFAPEAGLALGDGRINAFNPRNGRFEGALRKGQRGPRLEIDGLWALEFGNGTIGTPQTLLFTAGPGDESHGLFGAITATKGGGH